MGTSKMVRNSIQTPDGTVLESRHRHDYQYYLDANGKAYIVDGGLDYMRCSTHTDQINTTVFVDDSHEDVREAVTWGTYGINGDQPLKYVKLCDMDTDHIEACLETQKNMYPQIREAFKNEITHRNENSNES